MAAPRPAFPHPVFHKAVRLPKRYPAAHLRSVHPQKAEGQRQRQSAIQIMIEHTPVPEKLLMITAEPGGFPLLFLSNAYGMGINL